MIQRILKTQLFLFFLLTSVSFAAFYFQESLPDNFFSISSSSASLSTIGYYFFTLIASAGFYIGPWVFAPFVISSLGFTFLYGRRDRGWDVFVSPLVCLFTGSLFYYLAPEFMGPGLKHLLNLYVTHFALITAGIISFLAFCYLTFEKTFIQTLYRSAIAISKAPSTVWSALINLKLGERLKLLSQGFQNLQLNLVEASNKLKTLLARKRPHPALGAMKEESSRVVSRPIRREKKDVAPREVQVAPASQVVEQDHEELWSDEPAESYRQHRSQDDSSYQEIMNYFADQPREQETRQPDEEYFADIIQRIETKLEEFKIDGKIINVLKGPVVDTYELELGPGVKVSKVNGVHEDLSLALNGAPIRIVYPMKQKTTVGIEVPRNPRELILLYEVLRTDEFTDSKYRLPVAMGKDAFGETFVVDLASMPHMLVAGSTGAGKSVFINTLLMSLLVKKSPKEMRLILIDPKQLELALYADLPHLLMPVITDSKRSAIALMYAIQEMERRYTILKEAAVRDIESYNKKIREAKPSLLSKLHPYYDNDPDEEGYELPYIVVIVDEFADLILSKMGKDIEQAICRLAAKARASGIHLVLATQRPSVDVVTGLIKSNFPVRVSFRVTTATDSRTILGSMGAEMLLGKGDMLYRHGVETTRVHSSYVDEEEIEALVERMTEFQGGYSESAIRFLESGGDDSHDGPGEVTISFGDGSSDGDDLYREAVKVVVEHRAASASMLQRKLKIGYPRAANLIDELESKGIIGPAQGSKPRQVLSGESNP